MLYLYLGGLGANGSEADDLSMLLATGIMVHRLMSYGKTPQWSRLFGLGLSIYLVGVSFIHCYFVEQRLFQSTFVGMLILAVRKMSKVANERYKDPEIKGRLVRFGRTGTGRFLSLVAADVSSMVLEAQKLTCFSIS